MQDYLLHTIGAALAATCISLMNDGYHHVAITGVLAAALYLMTT